LDTVKSIKIVGVNASDHTNKDTPWIQNWSPEQSLRDYFTKPCILENGSFRFPDIFSNRETVDFGCFGKHEVSLHSHEEVYSLPRTIGKGLCNCEIVNLSINTMISLKNYLDWALYLTAKCSFMALKSIHLMFL